MFMHSQRAKRTTQSAGLPECAAIAHGCTLLACVLLTACSATVNASGDDLVETALSSIGLKKPDNAMPSGPTRSLKLKIEAAKDLNAEDDGQGLATVMRLYKLRDRNNFLSMPHSGFGASEKEKQALGGDLIEVRELILTPGQRLAVTEKMPGDAAYLGIVTLFRSPSPQRWRFAFAAAEAERTGITVGVHTCAMTATNVAPAGMSLAESTLLSAVRCN